MAKEPKKTIRADIWRGFSNFCVTLVVCFFIGWLIAIFSDPVFVEQSDGSYVERTRWVGFQQVYILSVPACKEEAISDCLAVPEYKDSVSAAYQLGRLDYVTVSVALLALAITILGIFGFFAVKERAELLAEKAAKKVAQKKIDGIAEAQVNKFLADSEKRILEEARSASLKFAKEFLTPEKLNEIAENTAEARSMIADTSSDGLDDDTWSSVDTEAEDTQVEDSGIDSSKST